MVLPIAALMIGMGVKNKYESDKREAADAEDERAFRQETRARQRTAYAREDDLRAKMEQAGAPVAVDSAPVAPPIGSADVPRAPEDQGMRVGADTYTDPAAAQAAAAKANTPGAMMERQAGVLAAAGKPMDAAHLRTANRAEQLGKIQLDDAQRTHLNRMFDDDLNAKATSFDALAAYISSSKGDGQGGALQVKAVPSADGKKITLNKVNPDGSQVATEYTFDNTMAGLTKAKALLSRSVTPEGKLTHLHQQAQEEQAAAKLAEETRHNQATEQNAGDLTAAKIEMAQMRLDAARAKGAGAAPAPAPLWDDKADAFLRSKYVVKDDTTGNVMVDGAGMAFAKQIALAKAKANGGDTTIAIGQAMDVDQKLRAVAGGDAKKLNALREEYMARISASPAAPAAAKPAATPVKAAAPAKAAPAADAGPGLMERIGSAASSVGSAIASSPIVQKLSALGVDYESPQGKALLRSRVAEASKGGAPLTDVEALRAKQQGLL